MSGGGFKSSKVYRFKSLPAIHDISFIQFMRVQKDKDNRLYRLFKNDMFNSSHVSALVENVSIFSTDLDYGKFICHRLIPIIPFE